MLELPISRETAITNSQCDFSRNVFRDFLQIRLYVAGPQKRKSPYKACPNWLNSITSIARGTPQAIKWKVRAQNDQLHLT